MFLLYLQTSTDLPCLENSVKIPQCNREGLLWYEPDITPPSRPINTACSTFSLSTFTCATLSSFLRISFFEKLLFTLQDADSHDPALPGLTHTDVCLDVLGLQTISSHLHEIRRSPIMSACSTRPDSQSTGGVLWPAATLQSLTWNRSPVKQVLEHISHLPPLSLSDKSMQGGWVTQPGSASPTKPGPRSHLTCLCRFLRGSTQKAYKVTRQESEFFNRRYSDFDILIADFKINWNHLLTLSKWEFSPLFF